MKKAKSKKSAPKKSAPKSSGSNFLKDFLFALARWSAYLLLVIIVLYFITGYAMVESHPFFDYIHLDKELAFYMHKQLTVPFCVCMILHILPSLMK
jgi:cytochrome b subunit of formate dehydrogenase